MAPKTRSSKFWQTNAVYVNNSAQNMFYIPLNLEIYEKNSILWRQTLYADQETGWNPVDMLRNFLNLRH